jgi:hypothetical protein
MSETITMLRVYLVQTCGEARMSFDDYYDALKYCEKEAKRLCEHQGSGDADVDLVVLCSNSDKDMLEPGYYAEFFDDCEHARMDVYQVVRTEDGYLFSGKQKVKCIGNVRVEPIDCELNEGFYTAYEEYESESESEGENEFSSNSPY